MKIKVRVGEFRIDMPIKEAIRRVIESGRISESTETRKFEQVFASYIGMKFGVAVNSGTSALIVGLLAIRKKIELKLNKKIKAITSPVTYIATANAITLTDFEPVFVDINPETFSIDPECVKEACEKDKKGEIRLEVPVHLMGYVCDMDALTKIANQYGHFLFEDSSQAHGSLFNGKRAGSMSDVSSFSFYIAHNIQAGELGILLTNDLSIAKFARKIKANGRLCDCFICTRPQGKCPKFGKGKMQKDPRFLHDEIGYNFKTMEFPTAIASTQIARADLIASKRRQNVRILNDLLQKRSGLLKLPIYSEEVSYLGYPIIILDPRRLNRERLQLALESNGVETRPLFGCIPLHQPAYEHLKKRYKGKLPNAEYIGANGLYVGCHQYLTEDDLHFMAKAFDKSIKQVLSK